MNLEDNIKDVITKKMQDGSVEKLIEEKLEQGINSALDSMFGSWGDVTKVIEKEIKSVMVPYVEKYDYSEYIVKLDHVLKEVLSKTTLDNRKILENFNVLMSSDSPKEINVSELFEVWKEFVAKEVNTDDLEIDFDDEPSYEYVEIKMEVDRNEERNWSSLKYAVLLFECEHDANMNFSIPIISFDESEKWHINNRSIHDVSSLKGLSTFEVFLMKLGQNYTEIILNDEFIDDEVQPKEQPEPTY